MSHLPLDARAILHYLNELGYTNITAVQLKEFLKDLRKLIKYEESVGVNIHHDDYYEGLFRRTTASYRAKVDQENAGQKSNGQNYASSIIKGGTKNQRQLDNKENKSTASATTSTSTVASNKCYKELLEENGRRNYSYHRHENPKNVLENYYHDWQAEKTLKTNNDHEENKNSNINFQFNKIKEKKEKIDFSSEKVTRQIIDEILDKIRTNSMNGKKENGLTTTTTYSRIREMVIEELREQLERNLHSKLMTKAPTERTHEEKRCSPPVRTGVRSSPTSPTLAIKSNSIKIKRLPREKVKKPYWEVVQPHREQGGMGSNDNNKNDKSKMPQYQRVRSKSPNAVSSNASSGRTTNSSSRYRSRSVLVSRSSSSSRRHKPRNSDPVALYQYYKNEWAHFSKQIPGQTKHQQLRWQIKQRLMDSD